jgi:FkbM family methyltransferase
MSINYLYRVSPKFYTKVMYFIFAYGIRFIYILFNLQKGILIYAGVNEGDSLTRIFYKFKRCICIEANPNLCKKLKKLFYFNNVEVYNYLLGPKNGYGFLNVYKSNSTNSTLSKIYNQKIIIRIKVKMTRLDTLLNNLKIKYINFYISDLEGLDFEVLKTLKSFIDSKKINYIQHECIINKRRNPYVKFSNYEYLFNSLLSKKYKKIASGRDKLRIGKFVLMSKKSLYKDILWKAV